MSETQNRSKNGGPIIVHLGAHRTGTTLFQEYLYEITSFADSCGYTLIGIDKTRGGLMAGLLGHPGGENTPRLEAKDSLRKLEQLFIEAKDARRGLVLSDENIIGSMEFNIQCGGLYPDLAIRMRNLYLAFRHVDRFYITIRDLEAWWTSCLSYLISVGLSPPYEEKISEIGASVRSWKNVVTDISLIYPKAQIHVREFSYLTDNPKRQLIKITNCKDFEDTKRIGKQANRSKDMSQLKNILVSRGDIKGAERLVGESSYRPFPLVTSALLESSYQEDLAWFRGKFARGGKFLESHE